MIANPPARADQPFTSLAEVQEAHLALRRVLDPFETPDAAAAQDRRAVVLLRHRIRRFEQRVAAAGQVLDDCADRDLTQSLLDYWSIRQSYLIAQAGRLRASARGDTRRRAPVLPEAFVLAPFDETLAPALADDQSPFIGLNAFTEADAGKATFYGRTEAVRELIELTAANRLLVVTGSSGCGKSSVIMAGLLPALRAGALLGSDAWHYWPAVLPGADPIAALLGAIRPAAREVAGWVAQWRASLNTAPARLLEVAAAAGGGGPSLLVIDQTEELLTLTMAQPAREAFLVALLALVTPPDPAHRVILVIREDFLSRLQTLKPLADLPDGVLAVYRPKPMTAGELRVAIEEPARAVALKFDPGVVDDLVREVAGDPAALPMLQFTLAQLWQRRKRNRITREAYEAVGRPADALERTAERVYTDLRTQEAQDAVRDIFLALVVPAFATGVIPDDADRAMIGSEWVRRRVRREALHRLRDSTRIDRVLDAFVQAGLIRMTPGFERDEDRFDVMHEALLRNWRRLSGWLVEKRRENEKQLQVLTAARQWNNADQHADRLAVGEALTEARIYVGDDPLIAQYVAASERAASASQVVRWRNIGVFAITFFGLAVMAIAWIMARSGRVTADKDLANSTATVAVLVDRFQQEKQEIVKEEAAQAPTRAATLPTVKEDGPGVTGYVWIGNSAQPLVREAVTGRIPAPASVHEGGRYRMRVDVALRGGWPLDNRYNSPPRLFGGGGTAAAGSLIVVEAVKTYDRPSGKQYWIRARLVPQVFPQYPETGAERIATILVGLRERGYDVPAPERVPAAASKSEVRFYYVQDKAAAARLARDVVALGGAGPGRVKVQDLSRARIRAAAGTLELWLDPKAGDGG